MIKPIFIGIRKIGFLLRKFQFDYASALGRAGLPVIVSSMYIRWIDFFEGQVSYKSSDKTNATKTDTTLSFSTIDAIPLTSAAWVYIDANDESWIIGADDFNAGFSSQSLENTEPENKNAAPKYNITVPHFPMRCSIK